MNIKYKIIIISLLASLLCLFGMINNKVPSHGQSPPQLLLELVNALWGQILAVILIAALHQKYVIIHRLHNRLHLSLKLICIPPANMILLRMTSSKGPSHPL